MTQGPSGSGLTLPTKTEVEVRIDLARKTAEDFYKAVADLDGERNYVLAASMARCGLTRVIRILSDGKKEQGS